MFQSLNNDLSQKIVASNWYVSIGWSLIPINPNSPQGKVPAIKWKKYQTERATIEEVHEWVNRGLSLAVVGGSISGIAILDDDRPKYNLPLWGLQSSIIAGSMHNGCQHYYYLHDREIKSRNSKKDQSIHIDIKASGGYCVLPPFGGRKWITKPSKTNLEALIPLPQEMVNLICPPKLFIQRNPQPTNHHTPIKINGESWLQRIERAKQASPDDYIFPYLHNIISENNEYILSECPFHHQETPSFYLYKPISNFSDYHYKCYGGYEYGIGVIAFHMERKQIDFKQAVRELAP